MSTLMVGTVMLTLIGLFSQLLGFLYRVLLSRLIGAEAMGLYQLVMPIYSILMSMTAAGLTVAVATCSAKYTALGDPGAVKGTLRCALKGFLAIALPLGIFVIAASDPISVRLIGDARTRLGIMVLIPCVLLTGVENLHKHCFYGMGRIGPPAATEAAEQVIRMIAVLVLLKVLNPGTEEQKVGVIAAGMVLCEVFSALCLAALLKRHWAGMRSGSGCAEVNFRQMARVALPVGLTSLMGTLLSGANAVMIPNRLVAGGMERSAAMSEFGVMCGMTLPLLALPTGLTGALCLTMVPDLARRTANGDRRTVGLFLDHVLSDVMMLTAPAMAILSVVGPSIGQRLYGEPAVGQDIGWLAVGTLLSCCQAVLTGALNGVGLERTGARNAIWSDMIQLGITFFAVPCWGMRGFAVGYVLSALVGSAMNLTAVLQAVQQKADLCRWFVRPLLAATLLWVWDRLLFFVLCRMSCPMSLVWLFCIVFGVVIYAAALQAQGVSIVTVRHRTRQRGDGKV